MKKFGKLRQWTDEKLGSTQKTMATEEFRDLEAEMLLRQQGLEAMLTAIIQWMRALGKKKEGQDKEKGTPLELLGIAMFQHAEDFSPDSAYGQGLNRLGIAQQKIARAQDIFQQTVSDAVIMNMEKSLVAMKDYQAARKKLESRRLTYDSTLSRMQKTKKEDAKLEEELRAATARYEETSDDVHTRMISIREAEQASLLDLIKLVEAEAEYFSQAQSIMLCLQQSLSTQSEHRIMKNSSLSASVPTTADRSLKPSRIMSQSHMSMPSLLSTNDEDGRVMARRLRPSVGTAYTGTDTRSQLSVCGPQFTDDSKRRNLTGGVPSGTLEIPRRVVANFAFNAENANEISLQPGDVVAVLDETTEGWWEGRILDAQGNLSSRKGLFPANYCSPYTTLVIENEYKKEILSHPIRQAAITDFTVKAAGRGRPPPPPVPKKKGSAFQRISSLSEPLHNY